MVVGAATVMAATMIGQPRAVVLVNKKKAWCWAMPKDGGRDGDSYNDGRFEDDMERGMNAAR